MSQSANDTSSAAPKRRKLNPATCRREDLLTHFSVDPGTGLSPKEADRRRDFSLNKPLYACTSRRFSTSLLGAVREVSLWILIAVAVFALFFDRVALGLVCLALTIGHVLLCVALSRRADRVDAAMQASDAPLARVLRGGTVRRVGADALVPGDIILLHPGDMIPADARLLRGDALVISERPFVAEDADHSSTPERLEKDADAMPTSGTVRRHSPVNMVFAGGVVEAGFAVALVVAVGSNTHLGGLVGAVAPAHPERMPGILRQAARPLSVINLCLVALVIPLTAIGILTLRDRYELLDIVLSALALATLTLTEHMLIKGRALTAAHRRDAATLSDRQNRVDIKSAADLGKLTTLDDVLLMGTSALHDGRAHPVALRIGTTTYRCDHPDADDASRALTELLYLYEQIMSDPIRGDNTMPAPLSSGVLSMILPELTEWSEMDREALALKAKEIRCENGWVSAIMPTVEGNRRMAVRLVTDFQALYACDECFTAGALKTSGRDVPPGTRPSVADERLEELRRHYVSVMREGLSAFFVITATGGRSTVHAMVTYAPAVCAKIAGTIRAMEDAGVRVSAYLRDVSPANTRILAACGLTDVLPADRSSGDPTGMIARMPALLRLNAGCRAFEGCTDEYILKTIRELKAAGRTVAVLSVEGRDITFLNEADLAISCAPSVFASAEEGELRLDTEDVSGVSRYAGPDGQPNGTLTTDRCRRRADILVRRTDVAGGGVCGLRTALLAADRTKAAIDRLYTYFLLAQVLRLVSTIIPLCLGLAPAVATTLLISGLLGDVLVYLSVMTLPPIGMPAHRRSMKDGLGNPWHTHRTLGLVTVGAAALPWIVAGVAKLIGTDFGGELTHYGLLCLLSLQLALFCTDRMSRRDPTVFFGTLAVVLLYVGALAGALGAGLALLWSLVIPAILGVAYGAVLYILRRHDGLTTGRE